MIRNIYITLCILVGLAFAVMIASIWKNTELWTLESILKMSLAIMLGSADMFILLYLYKDVKEWEK